jgi:hypothetical protein
MLRKTRNFESFMQLCILDVPPPDLTFKLELNLICLVLFGWVDPPLFFSQCRCGSYQNHIDVLILVITVSNTALNLKYCS